MPPDEPPEEPQQYSREPLSPAKRKRLQQIFEHASKQLAQDNYDYANELFAQCVAGDPANLSYVQSLLGNLQKKYKNNRTGSKLAMLKARGARSAAKKALSGGKWEDVIRNGLKVLAANPWFIPTLTAMATASEKMGDDEVEMRYLKAALESNPKDPDVNRQCAIALSARQQFDQAIACWHRVEQVKPNDEEAQRAIASLAVEKTIVKGGYEEADGGKKLGGSGDPDEPQVEITVEQRLQRTINSNPEELAGYFELAQYHINNEDYEAAEKVFADAYEVSDGDPDVRERWEDAQLRHLRQKMMQANDDGDKETFERLRRELYERELAVYKNRCERYPNNLAFKYDLGRRYLAIGQYTDAIKEFQRAKNDPSRKGVCMLALGRCFVKIKQYGLARSSFVEAIEEIPDRDTTNKKEALYRAAKLEMAIKDFEAAERHFTTVAAMDFAYRDVSELLEKLAKLREKEEGGGE